MVRRALILALLASAFAVAAPARPCEAATNRATMIIESKPDAPLAHCVGFDGEQITVLDLLERSGVGVRYQDYGGGNVFVCQIGGVGCDYPKQPCTCMYGEKKLFWGLYLRRGETWAFAKTGAGTTVVKPGDTVGWRWGDHAGEDAPPGLPAGRLCAAASAVSVPKRSGPGAGFGFGLIALGMVLMFALVRYSGRTKRDDEVSL